MRVNKRSHHETLLDMGWRTYGDYQDERYEKHVPGVGRLLVRRGRSSCWNWDVEIDDLFIDGGSHSWRTGAAKQADEWAAEQVAKQKAKEKA